MGLQNDTNTTVVEKTALEGVGSHFGQSTSDKISFYGVTPIAQRSGSAQAAVATTAPTSTTPYGFGSSAQAAAIVTLVNELRAALVAAGLIAGA